MATTRASDDPATRTRLVRAAIECILEEGYYRASSNRIAARAGMSWGVIQYHFGTRENLLLAVVGESADRLQELLAAVTIEGETTETRLASLADAIWSHYGQPEFVASMQVILNLSRDPRTSSRTAEILIGLEEPVSQRWRTLIRQALPGADQAVASTVFETLRGVAIGESLLHAFPHRRRPPAIDRNLVVRALASSLEDKDT